MTDKTEPRPYSDNAAYLDAEISYIQALCTVLGVEDRLRQDSIPHVACDQRLVGDAERASDQQAKRLVTVKQELRSRLRQKIDARLEASRHSTAGTKLGLDILCEEYRLGAQERLCLLVLTVPAISIELGDSLQDRLGRSAWCGAPTVETLVKVLEPRCVADRLKARKLFRRDAPLLRHGLINVEYPSRYAGPDDQLGAVVRLTSKGFARIVRDPEFADDDQQDSEKAV